MNEIFGMPGIKASDQQAPADDPQRTRGLEHLLADVRAERVIGCGARHDDAAGHRNQQRRNDGDQAVADGEDGVGLERLLERHALLKDADQESGDDVDGHDEDGGQRVALAEARRAVHGAAELRFARHQLAPLARLVGIDESGVQIGVDRHLLAGHGVEREARRDFGGANRAVTDHEILNGDQREKDDEADNVVAADHELAECLDHLSGGRGAFAAVQQDAPRAGQIERQAHQRQQKNEAGKYGELHRTQNLNRGEQHQHRRRDAEREQQVEHEARQRHQHHKDQRDRAGRNEPVGVGAQRCQQSGLLVHCGLTFGRCADGRPSLRLAVSHFVLCLVDHHQNLSDRVIQRGRNWIANLDALVERLRQRPVLHHRNVVLPGNFLDLCRQNIEALGHHDGSGHVRFVAKRDRIVRRVGDDDGRCFRGLQHLLAPRLALQFCGCAPCSAGLPSVCFISSFMILAAHLQVAFALPPEQQVVDARPDEQHQPGLPEDFESECR